MSLPSDFFTKYGPWAVVTGSSSGIGAEFARQLAAAGLSLVLVARRRDRLDTAAKSLMEEFPIKVKTIVADLTSEDGIQEVIEDTREIDVGLLVNNAGMELHGSFFRDPPEKHQRMIALNITAVTTLAHVFGMRLGQRKKGGVIFTSSMAAAGFPSFASYSATKSYVSSLSVLLRRELAPRGVDVLCLEPGVVKSEMADSVAEEVNFAAIGSKTMPTDDCVKESLSSLRNRKAKITPGFMNRFRQGVMGLFPEQTRLAMMDTMIDRAMPKEMRAFPEA